MNGDSISRDLVAGWAAWGAVVAALWWVASRFTTKDSKDTLLSGCLGMIAWVLLLALAASVISYWLPGLAGFLSNF